jgi:hypothetical protein
MKLPLAHLRLSRDKRVDLALISTQKIATFTWLAPKMARYTNVPVHTMNSI